MTDKKKPQEYEVGYGKPPKRTQFAKGQSGNPNGRPKGSGNFSSTLEKELKSRIMVTENGKRKTITKRETIAKQIVNKVLSGDFKSLPALLNEIRQLEAKTSQAEAPVFTPTQTDKTLMEDIMRELRQEIAEEMSQAAVEPEEEDDDDDAI